MIFLQETDFFQIQDEILQAITNDNTSLITTAELATIEEMTSYLRMRYDVALIFEPATTGEPDLRNKLIVMYAVDILLYHLHASINPRQIPEIRFIRYEAAISWLKKVSKGEIMPNLPLLQEEKSNTFRWISNPQKSR